MTLLLLLNAQTSVGGGYVVSFVDYAPSARYDGQPWTSVRVDEAPAPAGPWTELVTASLTPADTDPTNPQARNITVTGATLAAGWYQVTFLDLDGNQQPTRPVYSGAGIAPSQSDIARRLRTAAASGGAFSDTTTPTGTDVDGFIRSGVRRVRMKVGAVNPDLAEDAKEVVELYAAAQAELARWPEQAGTQNSPYESLMAEFREALADLVLADEQLQPDPADDPGVITGPQPIGLWPGRGVNRPVRNWWWP